MALNRHIRLCILIIIFINYATSKNAISVNKELRPQNLDVPYGIDEVLGSLLVPADSTTIWFEDFESDISDWRIEDGWELTQESSNSPTHSFHMDDDNYGISASILLSLIHI